MTAKHTKKSQSHALDLTEHWLRVSIKIIDRNAGEGYAKAHPELISAFMTTALKKSLCRRFVRLWWVARFSAIKGTKQALFALAT